MQQLLSIINVLCFLVVTCDPLEFACFSLFEWLPSLASSYCPVENKDFINQNILITFEIYEIAIFNLLRTSKHFYRSGSLSS
jgi:hypothetical protein